jgi:hypothetical protein
LQPKGKTEIPVDSGDSKRLQFWARDWLTLLVYAPTIAQITKRFPDSRRDDAKLHELRPAA